MKYQLAHKDLRWVLKCTCKVDASWAQVIKKPIISVKPCTHTHTSVDDTETNLCQLDLGGQTVINLRVHVLACKLELNQSEHQLLQVCARYGLTE